MKNENKVQRVVFRGKRFWFLVFWFLSTPLNAFFNAAALKKGFINTSTHQHISTSNNLPHVVHHHAPVHCGQFAVHEVEIGLGILER
jgi:hypothetical protein